MKHRVSSVLFLALCAVVGCGSTETSQPSPRCSDGQVYDSVLRACVNPEVVNMRSPDYGSHVSDDIGHEGDAKSVDMRLALPDVGVNPDLPSTVDQGEPPRSDMGAIPFRRFVAIGDTGTGSPTQIQVGSSIGMVCESLGGCDFGLLLGDNIYDTGVDSVDDMLFNLRFVIPYGHLPFPFFAVLGNHDLGGDGLGIDLDQNKAQYQIDYGQTNPQWIMPAKHYRRSEGPVFLVGLNTTDLFFENDAEQRRDIPNWFNEAGDQWKIAFGHHPYISNGPHGNAGSYEGLPFLPIVNGKSIQDFMEDIVCGKADIYLCGHDHSRQDLVGKCGTEFVVSGAGAKTTDLEGSNATHFQADTEGFALFEAWPRKMTIRFYDENGNLDHSREITR